MKIVASNVRRPEVYLNVTTRGKSMFLSRNQGRSCW